MSAPVPLHDADDERVYGGKAHFLSILARSQVRIPEGIALPTTWVDRFGAGDASARDDLGRLAETMVFPVAVRSSAVGEDSRAASHAGQFTTKLHVRTHVDLAAAVIDVLRSAAAAEVYRARVGITDPAAMGIVIQRMLTPRAAGVAFTCDPVTGAPDILIEANWGLGEAVVSGLVTPDFVRVARDGSVVESRVGEKHMMLVASRAGGTEERALSRAESDALCLSRDEIAEIAALALRCEAILGGPADVEWAVTEDGLFALQCRPATATG